MTRRAKIGSAIATMLIAPLAMAHPGHETTAGFVSGVMHPFSGLDHLLAMLAVGILAGQRGGKNAWALPIGFLASLIIGGALALVNFPLPLVEPTLLASVLVLGTCVAIAGSETGKAMLALPFVFGVFHGYAHVAETPDGSSLTTYALGFLLASMAIVFAGVALGLMARRSSATTASRYAGAAIAVCGALLITHLI
jgi:urease accessory protein